MIIFGHRGAAGEAPENTIAALRHAMSQGITRFEIDLRLSADDQLVVLHDNNLLRTTGIDQAITEVHSKDLAKLTVYGRNDEHTTGIPTLRQLFDQCQAIDLIQLELKSDETTNKPLLIRQLGRFFPDKKSTVNIVATSFDVDLLNSLKTHYPHIPIGLVSQADTNASIAKALKLNCKLLCLQYELANKWNEKTIRALTASALHVSLWTVNDPDAVSSINRLPVNSIITDFPSRFRQLK